MFLQCQPLLGSCTRGMNRLCTSRHNNRYPTTIHVVHFTLTRLLQWTKTRIFPFLTFSSRVLLNKSCSSGVMVQLPMWLKRALLPPLLQSLIVRKQNGHHHLTASALWHFIKLFSVVLEPQQHPAQPVTVYNSVPDYPRTVKCKWIMHHRNSYSVWCALIYHGCKFSLSFFSPGNWSIPLSTSVFKVGPRIPSNHKM